MSSLLSLMRGIFNDTLGIDLTVRYFILCSQMQQKSVCALPFVLPLNCQLDGEQEREFWRSICAGSYWVPLSMEVTLDEGNAMTIQEMMPSEGGDKPSTNPKVCMYVCYNVHT